MSVGATGTCEEGRGCQERPASTSERRGRTACQGWDEGHRGRSCPHPGSSLRTPTWRRGWKAQATSRPVPAEAAPDPHALAAPHRAAL